MKRNTLHQLSEHRRRLRQEVSRAERFTGPVTGLRRLPDNVSVLGSENDGGRRRGERRQAAVFDCLHI